MSLPMPGDQDARVTTPVSLPDMAVAPEPAPAPENGEWRGAFTPYVVGAPGRAAARVQPAHDRAYPNRPDTIVDGIVVHGPAGRPVATVRAASVRGLSHRHYARTRQDDYALRLTPDGRYLVFCVADGVSSGAMSHFAAWWAAHDGTKELIQWLSQVCPEDLPWEKFLDWVADMIVAAAGRFVEGIGTEPREVATEMAAALTYTVVDLAATKDGHTVHMITVGDTSGWILTKDGHWHPLQAIKNAGADIYSSAVVALPVLPDVPPQPVRTRVRPGEVLVLMTDGVGDPLGDGSGAVGRFLAQAWREPPADVEFAAQVGFARSTFDDDRTVVAVWPGQP